MIEWLLDNLATILIGLFGAGGWLGYLVNKYNKSKENRLQTNKELKAENEKLREKLLQIESIEEHEKLIDKSRGTIYFESLPNGKSRPICGFCWENTHSTVPVLPRWERDECWAYCIECRNSCTYFDNDYWNQPAKEEDDGELPF